jgi:hypothetical protein
MNPMSRDELPARIVKKCIAVDRVMAGRAIDEQICAGDEPAHLAAINFDIGSRRKLAPDGAIQTIRAPNREVTALLLSQA